MAESHQQMPGRALNKQMFGKLLVIAILMFGFGYALVPIYKKICEITGINILTTQDVTVKAAGNTQIDKYRLITVEFDANVQGPWRFRPTVNSLQIHPGEMAQVVYEVVNTQARSIDAQAIPSYAPQQVAAHFKKVECFCFKQQKFEPGEERKLTFAFSVSPQLPPQYSTLSVSYTFFKLENPPQDKSWSQRRFLLLPLR